MATQLMCPKCEEVTIHSPIKVDEFSDRTETTFQCLSCRSKGDTQMGITADELREKGLATRRATREAAEKEARELYQQGKTVEQIAVVLGKKYKKNGTPYYTGTIYDYLGGTKPLKESR